MQEEELKVKSARLAELNAELNIDERTPMEQAVDEASNNEIDANAKLEKGENKVFAKSEKPSLLAKLQRPLPNTEVKQKLNELEV